MHCLVFAENYLFESLIQKPTVIGVYLAGNQLKKALS